MAKPRISVTDSDEVERDSRAEELAELNESEGGELFSAIDELSITEGVVVMVIRISPKENEGYCGKIAVGEFSVDTIKAKFGPGKYKCRIKGPKGFLPGGGNLTIAADVERPHTERQSFESFQEWQAKRDAEASDRRNRMMELILPSAITTLGGLFTAMAGRSQGPDLASLITVLKPAPAPTITDLATGLASIQALNKQPDNNSAIDNIVKIMDVVKDFGGDSSGGKTGWLDIVKELINQAGPAVKPILENLQAQAMARAQGSAATPAAPSVSVQHVPLNAAAAPSMTPPFVPPVGAASAGAAENSNPTTDDEKMFVLFKPMIKESLATIAGWAEKDKSPELYAEVFIDSLPEGIEQYLPAAKALEYIDHEKWFEFVCELEPRLTSRKEWLTEFRAQVKELISEPADEEYQTDDEKIDKVIDHDA